MRVLPIFFAKYNVSESCIVWQLGVGGFATVRKALCKPQNINGTYVVPKPVAVKIIDQKKMSSETRSLVLLEVSIMKSLSHPNIVRCFDFFETPDKFLLVLELMTGGELFDRIAKKLAYTENEARNVMFDLLNALEHCHKNKIMHRGTRFF